MLTEKKKRYFQNLLSQRLKELLADVNSTVNDMMDLNTSFPDPSDRATAESEKAFTLNIRNRDRRLIEKIEESLQRIENGTYGICDECEEEISEMRLKARPVTTLCIECKRREEVEEKLRGL